MDETKIYIYTNLSCTEGGNLKAHIRLHNTGVTHISGGADYLVLHTSGHEM